MVLNRESLPEVTTEMIWGSIDELRTKIKEVDERYKENLENQIEMI
jgi:hypothetical protein